MAMSAPAAQSSTVSDHRKSKKRAREAEAAANASTNVDFTATSNEEPKHKKKKKKRTATDAEQVVEAPLPEDVPASTSSTDKPTERTEKEKRKEEKRKKKKEKQRKKDKGKGVQDPTDPLASDDLSQDAESSNPPVVLAGPANDEAATSAAFLSALVSAAAPGLHDHSIAPAYNPIIDPFLQFPHPHPHPHGPFPLQAPPHPYMGMPMLHPPLAMANAPFTDMSFGSNDDILRAFQDLDMAKLTSALKTLSEAAGNGSSSGGSTGVDLTGMGMQGLAPHQLPRPLVPSSAPSRSANAHANADGGAGASGTAANRRGKGKTKAATKHKRTIDMGLAAADVPSAQDSDILTKWLSVTKLKELADTQGLVYRKGKFSAIEAQQVKDAIESYAERHCLTVDQVRDDIIFSKEKGKESNFFVEITASVPLRPVIAVYHYIKRAYHPNRLQGEFTAEQDASLKNAVMKLGHKWEKVAEEVGRTASDCRDRYRNHIHNRDLRKTGAWSREEENELTDIVTEMQQGKDLDSDIFWGKVSDRMQGRRNRQQCRIKWLDSLMNRHRNEGENARWSAQDAYILVHKVDSMNVRDDSEIDWKILPDPDWNAWSAHVLQRRWLTLKRGVKGYEDMTHQEIMDILRTKWAHLPASSTASTKAKRKVVSAETIDDEDDEDVQDEGADEGEGIDDSDEGDEDEVAETVKARKGKGEKTKAGESHAGAGSDANSSSSDSDSDSESD